MELADSAVHAVRRIATELRPGILDDLGLQESMKWMVQEFGERTGIEAEFRSGVEGERIDPDRSTAFFRILQEARRRGAEDAGFRRVFFLHLRENVGATREASTQRL